MPTCDGAGRKRALRLAMKAEPLKPGSEAAGRNVLRRHAGAPQIGPLAVTHACKKNKNKKKHTHKELPDLTRE